MAVHGKQATQIPVEIQGKRDEKSDLDQLPRDGACAEPFRLLMKSYRERGTDKKEMNKAATMYIKSAKTKGQVQDVQLMSLRKYLDDSSFEELKKAGIQLNLNIGENVGATSVDQGPSNPPRPSSASPRPGRARGDNKGQSEDQSREQQTIKELEKKLRDREIELKEKEEEIKRLDHEKTQKFKEEKAVLSQLHKEEISKLQQEYNRLLKDLNEKINLVRNLELNVNEHYATNTQLEADIQQLQKENEYVKAEAEHKLQKMYKKLTDDHARKFATMNEDHECKLRDKDNKIKELMKERDDLRDRFSKVAGDKLTDKNADIADLSDPNRAMKVSERFGQLYDDDWTNAFEALTENMIPPKEAIQWLLKSLEECMKWCASMTQTQMDSIKNVFLHPSQDLSMFQTDPRKNVGGSKDRPRISSKDEKALRDVRRQIGVNPNIIEEVKQLFHLQTKAWEKKGQDVKKMVELCNPYLLKCAEVCWLMVLHEPPLFMKLDVKSGEKLDLNTYTVYSSSGDKIDYLVWPPLYNGKDGGLLSKGVIEPQRTVKKK